MPLFKYAFILGQLDHLIKNRRTGTPKEFAGVLNISERMLYIYLSDMRKIGAFIEYDTASKSYIYSTSFDLQSAIEVLSQKAEMENASKHSVMQTQP